MKHLSIQFGERLKQSSKQTYCLDASKLVVKKYNIDCEIYATYLYIAASMTLALAVAIAVFERSSD